MDSGYLDPSETEGKTIAEALEDDYDVHKVLLPEEVLGIMDQLLCHEVGEKSNTLSTNCLPLLRARKQERLMRMNLCAKRNAAVM